MNVNELIPGNIYYVESNTGNKYIFKFEKIDGTQIYAYLTYYYINECRLHHSSGTNFESCYLINTTNIRKLRNASNHEIALLDIDPSISENKKLKINHKSFKLKFNL